MLTMAFPGVVRWNDGSFLLYDELFSKVYVTKGLLSR